MAESGAPGVIRLIASPIGAVMVRLPQRPGRVRAFIRQAGHGASLDAGPLPDDYIRWRVAFDRETDSMRNERDMVRAIVSWRKGLRPELTFADAELAAIQQPTLLVYGTADPVGTVEIWRRVVDLLPRGEPQLVDGAGHMPWLDDPSGVADHVSRFLATWPSASRSASRPNGGRAAWRPLAWSRDALKVPSGSATLPDKRASWPTLSRPSQRTSAGRLVIEPTGFRCCRTESESAISARDARGAGRAADSVRCAIGRRFP